MFKIVGTLIFLLGTGVAVATMLPTSSGEIEGCPDGLLSKTAACASTAAAAISMSREPRPGRTPSRADLPVAPAWDAH